MFITLYPIDEKKVKMLYVMIVFLFFLVSDINQKPKFE